MCCGGIRQDWLYYRLLSKPIRYGYLNGIALTVIIGRCHKKFQVFNRRQLFSAGNKGSHSGHLRGSNKLDIFCNRIFLPDYYCWMSAVVFPNTGYFDRRYGGDGWYCIFRPFLLQNWYCCGWFTAAWIALFKCPNFHMPS